MYMCRTFSNGYLSKQCFSHNRFLHTTGHRFLVCNEPMQDVCLQVPLHENEDLPTIAGKIENTYLLKLSLQAS